MKLRESIRKMMFRAGVISGIDYVRGLGVTFGADCRFVRPSSAMFGSEPYLVSLGDHVSVGEGVRFITHDGGVWVLRDRHPQLDVIAPIRVGNNVFVGSGAVLLPGVEVGDNCVIGAGSIVTKDVPEGSIVAGVPAKVVSTLVQYETRAIAKGIATKGLSPEAKKLAVLERLTADEVL